MNPFIGANECSLMEVGQIMISIAAQLPNFNRTESIAAM
jgi:hypothetical protein